MKITQWRWNDSEKNPLVENFASPGDKPPYLPWSCGLCGSRSEMKHGWVPAALNSLGGFGRIICDGNWIIENDNGTVEVVKS